MRTTALGALSRFTLLLEALLSVASRIPFGGRILAAAGLASMKRNAD
jgi:hypothetical protein